MKFALLVCLLTIASSSYAAKRIESCETGDIVPGKGWVYKNVPCSDLDHPVPCTREWTDEKGRWHSQVVDCPVGTKQKTYEQLERAEETAKEKRCGKDYGELRVGMTLKRFEQCNEALSYETESVGKGGIVEIYRSTFYWIHAKAGRIVGYTQRSH